MNNIYAMNMIVKDRQAEIRKQVASQRRIGDVERSTGMWSRGKVAMTLWNLIFPGALLGLMIVMFLSG